jgi:hypothetical protein
MLGEATIEQVSLLKVDHDRNSRLGHLPTVNMLWSRLI